jgi:hypothetical protein
MIMLYLQWKSLLKGSKDVVHHLAQRANIINIVLTYMQTVTITLSYSMNWPESIKKFAMWEGSLVMLDLFTFIAPECSIKLGFIFRWVTGMVSPLLLLGAGVGYAKYEQFAEGQGTAAYNKTAFEKVRAKRNAIEQLSTNFLLAWYLTILQKSLQPLACSPTTVGEEEGSREVLLLDADPTVRCWEGGQHQQIGILGITTFAAFGFLLPFVMKGAIYRAAKGKFIARWERFDYVLLAQKLVTATSLALPRDMWAIQWVLCFLGSAGVLATQWRITLTYGKGEGKNGGLQFLPYQRPATNWLSTLTLVSEQLILIIGLTSRVSDSLAPLVETLFFLLFFGTLIACAVLIYRDHKKQDAEAMATEEDGPAMLAALEAKAKAVEKKREAALRQLSKSDSTFFGSMKRLPGVLLKTKSAVIENKDKTTTSPLHQKRTPARVKQHQKQKETSTTVDSDSDPEDVQMERIASEMGWEVEAKHGSSRVLV